MDQGKANFRPVHGTPELKLTCPRYLIATAASETVISSWDELLSGRESKALPISARANTQRVCSRLICQALKVSSEEF